MWVRVPTLPNGDTAIYLYYGDHGLADASNPGSTFLFFDGFDEHMPGDFVNGWTPVGIFRAGIIHHTGKVPRRLGGIRTSQRSELSRLQRELNEAVEREDYEAAAALRDQIKAIQGDGT